MTVGLATIDISPLFGRDGAARQAAAEAIGAAAERDGFFYAAGCGLAPDTVSRLDAAARDFFALPEARKAEIAMARGGLAWRGWFPLGGELTSGVPDQKEGLYFGEELGSDDPRVVARWPLHGANPWPVRPAELRGVGPIHPETARRIACDAVRTVVTVAPSDGGSAWMTGTPAVPLSVGRATRTIPAHIRTALVLRDQGCRFPGCDRPPAWTDGHHIIHWSDGGPTELENLVHR